MLRETLVAGALALTTGVVAVSARPSQAEPAPGTASVPGATVLHYDAAALTGAFPHPAAAREAFSAPLPAPRLSDQEIAVYALRDPSALGPLSIGSPARGALRNGVQMPEGPLWHVVEPARSYGAPEAIASIGRAIETVARELPGGPVLYVGQLSAEHGGYLRPHRSHQSGRDVDLGYYYQGGTGWYARANAKNLDRPRTWALVRALASDPNVEAIFIDRSVQLLLREYALSQGVDRTELDEKIFEGTKRGRPTLVRHEWGHLTHLHVRFRCPDAVETGRRAAPVLARLGKISPAFAPRVAKGQPRARSTAATSAGSSGVVLGSKRPTT
ncbi:MAG TPA: penicillin-insensitive murein endopeptidase [Polyangiaceae bacterium]|nr:penicillin-insensitive murein endopeptidase [Polyangiaceae bacterium]